jgi:hypothetical protein
MIRTRLLSLGLVAAAALACKSSSSGSTTPSPGTGGAAGDSSGAGGAAGAAGAGGVMGGKGGSTYVGMPVTIPGTSCSGGPLTIPAYGDLPVVAALPDPFTTLDGTRISQKSQWDCRRDEIGAQAQAFELGPLAAPPDMTTGTVSGGNLTVNVTNAGKSISFTATITLPTTGTAPYPAMIGIGGIGIGTDQLNAMGVAQVIFPNDTIAQQDSSASRDKGAYYDLYGNTNRAGAMIAWAWGVGRLIDALESTPDAQIDTSRLGVTGCSRNGKGALIVGAYEKRIALTIPQESGAGGAASWRISDVQYAGGVMVQTLMEITGENVWFTDLFRVFNNTATRLPFDHHMIEGMVAPRALLVIENSSISWLGDQSTYENSMAAHMIWEALGIPDHMGVSQIGGHMHCAWDGSQQPEVTAYVQKFLVGGGTADTNVLKTDGGYTFDKATWVDWDEPALQ